jgi:drug/metabolite transporter (DMT)-like permease
MKRNTGLVIFCYITIYLVWGSTYFFIKESVTTIPPQWVMGVRWTIGGVLLLAVSLVRGGLRTAPRAREVLASIALGTLLILVGNGCITVAEQRIDSYIAALLTSSAPIVVAVFDRLLLRKALTPARLLGVVIGFGGVAVLLYNGNSIGTTLNASIIIGIVGAVTWGFATSLGHRFPVSGDVTVNSGIQMLFVGIVSLAGSFLFGPSPAAVLASASGRSLFGLAYLAVVGSLAFSAFTYLVNAEPAERVVSYALVNPLIALLIGLGLGGESPTPLLAFGVPLVLLGLAFMFYGERGLAWARARAGRRRR